MSIYREWVGKFNYDVAGAPAAVLVEGTPQTSALNCEALAHLATAQVLGIVLPPDLRCYESWKDTDYFETVPRPDDMSPGDWLWFGPQDENTRAFVPIYDDEGSIVNWKACPVQHVGVHTGERATDGDPLILHATPGEGSTIWPLRQFATQAAYAALHRIGRLRALELAAV
ncbi:MAG TPA: hypothetical protein VKQ34_03570 [Candidatus Saccharimonadales bacterium]|nr:hypothetical protein [Candidatus Saccharimonadales bacterium]